VVDELSISASSSLVESVRALEEVYMADPGYEVVTSHVYILDDQNEQRFTVMAPSGKVALGGGYVLNFDPGAHDYPRFIGSFPDNSNWTYIFRGSSSDNTGYSFADLYVIVGLVHIPFV
jgi:hypothetical protein